MLIVPVVADTLLIEFLRVQLDVSAAGAACSVQKPRQFDAQLMHLSGQACVAHGTFPHAAGAPGHAGSVHAAAAAQPQVSAADESLTCQTGVDWGVSVPCGTWAFFFLNADSLRHSPWYMCGQACAAYGTCPSTHHLASAAGQLLRKASRKEC